DELQSAAEELETTNEELHSTNEELETMNDELRERTDEALGANSFLNSILASIQQSVIVVDAEMMITAWSKMAEEVWGLRAAEAVGSFFLNLDIGLAVQDLRKPIRAILAGEQPEPMTLEGHDRRGNPLSVTVSFSPLLAHTGD